MTNEERVAKLEKTIREFNLVVSGVNVQGGFGELKPQATLEERLGHLEKLHEGFTIRGSDGTTVEGSLKTGFSVNHKCPERGIAAGQVPISGSPPPAEGCSDIQRFAASVHMWFDDVVVTCNPPSGPAYTLSLDFSDTQSLNLNTSSFSCPQSFSWCCGSPGTNQNCDSVSECDGDAPISDVAFDPTPCVDSPPFCPDFTSYQAGFGVSIVFGGGDYFLTVTFSLGGHICSANVNSVYGLTFPINDNIGATPSGLYSYTSTCGGTPMPPGTLHADVTLIPI